MLPEAVEVSTARIFTLTAPDETLARAGPTEEIQTSVQGSTA